MNYLNKNTPEGTRDLLYSEAELYDDLTRLFSKNYEMSGFRKVETPVIENYDLITAIDRSINQENLYKLTDNTGHLLALRPDNTTPIARIAATKLRNAELPQKLYYNQNIYRINTDYSGKRNEILQSGIELIGESGLKADLLCIMTALEALKSLGLKCKLEIGHVGFFNALLKELDLDDEEAATVRNFVEMKNFVSLNMFDKNLQNEKIRKLPLLYGDNEVFGEAAELASGNKDANDALDYVKKVYDMLDNAGYADEIMVDMGIVHKFDYYTGQLNIVREIAYSDGERANVRCFGADDVREGVAIMHHEGVDVSITGNSTNPTRFQHPVAGTYKKECVEQGKKYFSVASGGGTGRTLHPDNMAAGPASYGMTDTMGRMHSDAQFAGSSSVPAHVEMMGFLGMGNNPMVGATVAVAVAVEEAMKK